VEPKQVWPDKEPHWPSLDTGRLLVGVLAGADDVEDAKLLEVSIVAAQELTVSVNVVVAVTGLVTICVTV
jgi:hypothetical protein